jgi:integrase/recombinase XerC
MNADTNHAYVDGYLDNLISQRHLSPLTVENYRRDLMELNAFATVSDNSASLASITHFQIRKFASQLHAKGLNARSIARKLSAWRGFFGWMSEQNKVTSNPVDGIKAPKRNKPLPKALAADDAVRLVSENNPGKAADSTAQCLNCSIPAACAYRN